MAPFTGASFLRGTPIKNIINFRPSYQDEINAIVQYLYTKKKIRKFAVFYQNDDYGEEGYVSLLHTLKKHKLTLQGEGAYKRNTLSITHAFREIKKSKPQAILMIGANRANTLFIKTARKDKNFEKTIFVIYLLVMLMLWLKGQRAKQTIYSFLKLFHIMIKKYPCTN